MGQSVIVLGSVTDGLKVRKALRRNGINAEVIRVSGRSNDSGCSYGIKFRSEFLYDVVRILKHEGIDYSLLYMP